MGLLEKSKEIFVEVFLKRYRIRGEGVVVIIEELDLGGDKGLKISVAKFSFYWRYIGFLGEMCLLGSYFNIYSRFLEFLNFEVKIKLVYGNISFSV